MTAEPKRAYRVSFPYIDDSYFVPILDDEEAFRANPKLRVELTAAEFWEWRSAHEMLWKCMNTIQRFERRVREAAVTGAETLRQVREQLPLRVNTARTPPFVHREDLDGCILLTREEAAKVRRELIALARESRGYDAALPQNCLALLTPDEPLR